MTPIRESRELDWEGKHMIPNIGKWPGHLKTPEFRFRCLGWETFRAGKAITDRPDMGARDRAAFEIGYRCAKAKALWPKK